MKNFLALSLLLGSMVFGISSVNAETGNFHASTLNSVTSPQIKIQIGNRRRGRTVTRTRFIRLGRQRYRETYQITYFPNGRTRTRVISRVRVR